MTTAHAVPSRTDLRRDKARRAEFTSRLTPDRVLDALCEMSAKDAESLTNAIHNDESLDVARIVITRVWNDITGARNFEDAVDERMERASHYEVDPCQVARDAMEAR